MRDTFGGVFGVNTEPSVTDTLESSWRVDTSLLADGRLQIAFVDIFANILTAGNLEKTVSAVALIGSNRVVAKVRARLLLVTLVDVNTIVSVYPEAGTTLTLVSAVSFITETLICLF